MKIIGITGNSGSGKSTISKLISKNYEAKIIDADKIAKEMTKNNGEYLQAIRQAFGNDVIKNNELDRKKLADIVFLNRAEKEKLDGLTFEYVVEEIKKELEANQNLDYQYIILDVPLLFESKLDKLCDYTIGVIAPKTEKIKRICKRDKLSKEKALQRLNSQPNDEFFTKNCNTVINNENKEETIKMMNEIMLKLQ
ncbi:dephospho-CoA kinase [Clostridium sp. CAG:245]|jgi:dephospho-CoA kinase|nr:dephospho-CoA kinase [Clostridium sp. CAG:245]